MTENNEANQLAHDTIQKFMSGLQESINFCGHADHIGYIAAQSQITALALSMHCKEEEGQQSAIAMFSLFTTILLASSVAQAGVSVFHGSTAMGGPINLTVENTEAFSQHRKNLADNEELVEVLMKFGQEIASSVMERLPAFVERVGSMTVTADTPVEFPEFIEDDPLSGTATIEK